MNGKIGLAYTIQVTAAGAESPCLGVIIWNFPMARAVQITGRLVKVHSTGSH